ncbi:MAG: HAMP domain-containing histidine kinase [Firmicutes bacterium]|nr:HAMP domain-containing histidine kinase [Bacillota bacterium]
MKRFGIFAKVFLYTNLFLLVIVGVTIALFYQQFTAFYNAQQLQRLQRDYSILSERMLTANRFEMIEIAHRFAEGNQTFIFRITDDYENVLFSTPGDSLQFAERTVFINMGGYTLIAQDPAARPEQTLFSRAVLATIIILFFSVIGAATFALQITRPIKQLVKDTAQMSKLLPVDSPKKRNDEIGDLSLDVHNMYSKLKDTIEMLEDENIRIKELEESQRYFFSAASHELKTPIAATSLVLEGMLANVGDYSNHPKYLKECIKLMDEQSQTIYEILEIVNLDSNFDLTIEKFNLQNIVNDLLKMHTHLITQNITVDISQNYFCYADIRLLKKVLSNVLLNAIQNTPNTGEIKIFAESEKYTKSIKLKITNTGQINLESLPKLFNPFYRTGKANNRSGSKTGLGLTIVKKALNLMQLNFGIENLQEEVLFWVILPEE